MDNKRMMRWLFVSLIGLLMAGCGGEAAPTLPAPTVTRVPATVTAVPPTLTTAPSPTPFPTATPDPFVYGTDGYPWWNDTTFYEIFVRSFKDSDGDGIGDLNGIIEKLDYLNDGDPATADDLGVTGIWLMPIFESPSYHGYDVTDYYKVNPDYGTNEDLQRLIEEAHRRGIRVIIDLPLNHTSAQHPWFVESASDPNSDKRDWYVWEDENPGYRGPWGQKVWHKENDAWYYAVFWDQMPDLNYENPEVTAEMMNIVTFWQNEMGVDGFRLDGAKHLIENGEIQENAAPNHDWLQEFYRTYKGNDPDAFVVAEIWSPTSIVARYIRDQDEVDVAFEFDLSEAILSSVKGGYRNQVSDQMDRVERAYPPLQYATFIANHDMNRAMSQLEQNEGKAKVAAALQLTLPGVPFIYYGEEIGMTGVKPDENIRRPMQWDSESTKVGFSDGRPWKAVSPDYQTRSVALQEADPDSLLNHYRQLIRLRNEHEALRVGDWAEVLTSNGRVYAALRHSDNETILVLINLSSKEQNDYALSLDEGPLAGSITPTLLMGEGDIAVPEPNADGGFDEYKPLAVLPPYSATIIQLGN